MKNEKLGIKRNLENTFFTPMVRTKDFKNKEEIRNFVSKQIVNLCLKLNPRWILKSIDIVILPNVSYSEITMISK